MAYYIPNVCERRKGVNSQKLARLANIEPAKVTPDFHTTVAYAEQRIHRKIAAKGRSVKLTAAERALLVKMVNLHLYYRGQAHGFLRSVKSLAKQLHVDDRTIRRSLRTLEGMGIIIRFAGGLGRGNVSKWTVDLTAMRERLWPTFSVRGWGLTAKISKMVKADISRRAYIDTPCYAPKGARPFGLPLGKWASPDFLDKLAMRFAAMFRLSAPPAITVRDGCAFDSLTGEVVS